MTTGEVAYLILLLCAFLAFSAGLAYSAAACPGPRGGATGGRADGSDQAEPRAGDGRGGQD